MVGQCISYWNSPFLGNMLIFRGVNPHRLGTYHAKKLTLTTPPVEPNQNSPGSGHGKICEPHGRHGRHRSKHRIRWKGGRFFQTNPFKPVDLRDVLGQLKHVLFSSHTWGNDPILTHIFSNGFWNHQLGCLGGKITTKIHGNPCCFSFIF